MEFDIGISGLSGEELEGRRRMIESVNVDVFELICCPLSVCRYLKYEIENERVPTQPPCKRIMNYELSD